MTFIFPVRYFMYSFLFECILVTAKEIIRALENNAIDPQRMVSFFREIEDIDELDVQLKSNLIDTDDETEILLNQIKSSIRKKLPLENQFNYRVYSNEIYQTIYSRFFCVGELERCLQSSRLSSKISN